jgi:malate dehydrogenase (oxaloacetate-decarboxylating)(NADP+)
MMITGTAIISSALLNALELAGKEVEHTKIVVSGAGSAACANLYVLLGINPDNIIMFDKDGVISSERNDLSAQKKYSKGKPGITLGDALKVLMCF